MTRREALKEAHRKEKDAAVEITNAELADAGWLVPDPNDPAALEAAEKRRKARADRELRRKEVEQRRAAREEKRKAKKARQVEREAKRAEREARKEAKAAAGSSSSRASGSGGTATKKKAKKGAAPAKEMTRQQRRDFLRALADSDDEADTTPRSKAKGKSKMIAAVSSTDSDPDDSSANSIGSIHSISSASDSEASFLAAEAEEEDEEEEISPEERFRAAYKILKKMMPPRDAMRHARDMVEMEKGKAYHSDGHYSATPENSADEAARPRKKQRRPPQTAADDAAPGVARKIAPHHRQDDTQSRFELVGDAESEESSADDYGGDGLILSDALSHDGDDDADEWRGAKQRRERRRQQSEDAIDRMLSRARSTTGGARHPAASSGLRGSASRKRSRPGAARSTTSKKQSGPARRRTAPRASASVEPQSRPPKEKAARKIADLTYDSDQSMLQSSDDDLPAARRDALFNSSRKYLQKAPPGGGRLRKLQFHRRRGVGFNPEVVQMRTLRLLDEDVDAELFGAKARDVTAADKDSVTPRRAEDQQAVRSPLLAIHPGKLQPQNKVAPPTTAALPRRTPLAAPRAAKAVTPFERPPDPAELAIAGQWAELGEMRLELGIPILPASLRLHASGPLRRGDLHLWHRVAEEEGLLSVESDFFGVKLSQDAHDVLSELARAFDRLFDAIVTTPIGAAESAQTRAATIDDALWTLARWLAAMPDEKQRRQMRTTIISHLQHTIQRVQRLPDIEGPRRVTVSQCLVRCGWHLFVLCGAPATALPSSTEDVKPDDRNNESIKLLIHLLLSHGLHRTMQSIKTSLRELEAREQAENDVSVELSATVQDSTVDMWRALLHLLGTTFWTHFDEAYLPWLSSIQSPDAKPHTRGERIWFAIFSLCAISQFSAEDGRATNACTLPPHWTLALEAVTASCIRYSPQVELHMPGMALQQRDAYIDICLRRLLLLHDSRNWKLAIGDDRAPEQLLRQVCKQVFDAKTYSFANLPTEHEHDFPAFLCAFDEGLLLSEDNATDDVASFHHFLRVLIILAKERAVDAHADSDGFRETLRTCYRLLPVQRVKMESPETPTDADLSKLYNLYSLAAVTFFLAPDTREARTALRRIQTWLDFDTAGSECRLICIRAVQYFGVICQHHHLPLDDIMSWFDDVMKKLKRSAEGDGPASVGSGAAALRSFKKGQARANQLLKAALRAMRNIIENPALGDIPIERQPIAGKVLLQSCE